jgi:hypothetical protein
MIYGHDLLPAPGFPNPSLPRHAVSTLAPARMKEWAKEYDEIEGRPPNPDDIAMERCCRAYGHGSVHWDSGSSQNLPQGWVWDRKERQIARYDLLQDINDLASRQGIA